MQIPTNQNLGIEIHLSTSFDDALERVIAALKLQGFGVLTEIDVKETMKKKLGVEFRPYKILGACNPPLAHRALQAAPQVGLFLPCNVTVAANESGGVDIALVDPMVMLEMMPDPALVEIATEARTRLENVAAALSQAN